jgi:hypothetical protein
MVIFYYIVLIVASILGIVVLTLAVAMICSYINQSRLEKALSLSEWRTIDELVVLGCHREAAESLLPILCIYDVVIHRLKINLPDEERKLLEKMSGPNPLSADKYEYQLKRRGGGRRRWNWKMVPVFTPDYA